MPSAHEIRRQIEATLADRIPSALTPVAHVIRPVVPTGITNVDELLQGGLPVGAITEMVGPHSSGRTSLAFSTLASVTQTAKVCAWIDVSNSFDPESAAGSGIDLNRLLWVRCGVVSNDQSVAASKYQFSLPDNYTIPLAAQKGYSGGGYGPHPRTEINGLANAANDLLRSHSNQFEWSEPQLRTKEGRFATKSNLIGIHDKPSTNHALGDNLHQLMKQKYPRSILLSRISQGLRTTDLLLHTGGFSCIVLDMASILPEYIARIPIATWFRYRAAAEQNKVSFILLAQYSCAKSSAGLVLNLPPGQPVEDTSTLLTKMRYELHIEKRRYTPDSTLPTPLRKPLKSERQINSSYWHSQALWADTR